MYDAREVEYDSAEQIVCCEHMGGGVERQQCESPCSRAREARAVKCEIKKAKLNCFKNKQGKSTCWRGKEEGARIIRF